MATKLTITVPDELAKRLEPHREYMNISRICAQALEAELKSREEHLSSLARYEEFKRMRSEAEAIREQMVAQTGRNWQNLAKEMQRMLKDISREIEQLEKQIPEELLHPATEPELVEAEKLAEAPKPEPMVDKLADLPEPEPVIEKLSEAPASKAAKKSSKSPEPVLA